MPHQTIANMCDIEEKKQATASPYRISTITATGSVGTEIDLDLLFDELCVAINEHGVGKTVMDCFGFVYAEYGKKKSITYYKGIAKKYMTHNDKTSGFKRFDNQLTVVYRYNEDSLINIKVFKNGNIQMTGVKNTSNGQDMIDILINHIKQIQQTKHIPIVVNVESLNNCNYKIALINSDFKVNFEVKRDKLHNVLKQRYNIRCSFEPCIYPGVKIQYFWNIINSKKDGVCKCSASCINGKGNGSGDTDCKKITIAVFQSGCVIITGAQTTEQIDDTYEFICNVLFEHRDNIEKMPLSKLIQVEPTPPKNKVFIKKHLIVYPNTM
jgi:TATA-box binding protein (TBP) (component of TFIID and TFIIIB)